MPEPAWREHAARLADELHDDGVIGRRWRDAVAATPLHMFATCRIDDVPGHQVRLRGIYSCVPPEPVRSAAASIRRPRVPVAMVVRALQPLAPGAEDGPDAASALPAGSVPEAASRNRIWVADDPTGYQTALLCHDLGDAHAGRVVTSVPDLATAQLVRRRLLRLGHRPAVVVAGNGPDEQAGPGRAHASPRGPFDAVVGGAAVTAVPAAWLRRLAVAGRIVARWATGITTSVLVLDDTSTTSTGICGGVPAQVGGRTVAGRGHPAPTTDVDPVPVPGPWRTELFPLTFRTTRLDPRVLAVPELQWLLALHDPLLRAPRFAPRPAAPHGPWVWSLIAADRSWVEITAPVAGQVGYPVTEGGPRRIWVGIEDVVGSWIRHGRPGPDRYGLTASTSPAGPAERSAASAVWIGQPPAPPRALLPGSNR